jgi:hypothetical protein
MADINSYALSIELTLQSNAEQVLGSIIGQIDSIDARVQNMVQNLGNALNQFSGQITQNLGQLGSSVSSLNQNVNAINLAAPVQNMTTATNVAQQSVQALSNELELPTKLVEKLHVAMTTLGETKWHNDLDVDEAIKQYQYLANIAIPGLETAKKKLAERGMQLSSSDLKLLEQIKKVQFDMLSKQKKSEIVYQGLKKKWFETNKGRFKSDMLSGREVRSLSQDQLGSYRDLLIANREHQRLSTAAKGGGGISISPDAVRNMSMIDKTLAELPKKAITFTQKFNTVVGLIREAAAGVGKIATGIGLGPLVEAASLTGAYAVGVQKAAEREEKLHAINLRTVGSMQDIGESIRKTTRGTDLLSDELVEATTALRDVGLEGQEILDFNRYVAMLNRTTGASVVITAKLTKAMFATGRSQEYATKRIFMMQRAARTAGLAGQDLDTVMSEIADTAISMGTGGTKFTEQYSAALINAAAAAKRLGMSSSDAVNNITRFKDPLKAFKIVGADAFKLWRDPKAMQARIAVVTKEWLKQIDAIDDAGQQWDMAGQFGVLLDKPFATVDDIRRELQLLSESGQDVSESIKGSIDPAQEMQKAMGETSGLVRNQVTFMEKTFAELQKTMAGVKNTMEKMFATMNKSDTAPQVASWTILGTAAVSSITSIIQKGLELYGTYKLLQGGTNLFSGGIARMIPGLSGISGWFSRMIPSVSSITGWFGRMLPQITSVGSSTATLGGGLSTAAGMMQSFAGSTLVTRTGVAALVYYTGKLIYYTGVTAHDMIMAERSIKESNKALWEAKRHLKEQGVLIQGNYETEVQSLTVLMIKAREQARLSNNYEALHQLEKELAALQEKNLNSATANNKAASEFTEHYKEAVKAGDQHKALMAAIRIEASKAGMEVQTFMKDNEQMAKITQNVNQAVNKSIAERNKARAMEIDLAVRVKQETIYLSKLQELANKNNIKDIVTASKNKNLYNTAMAEATKEGAKLRTEMSGIDITKVADDAQKLNAEAKMAAISLDKASESAKTAFTPPDIKPEMQKAIDGIKITTPEDIIHKAEPVEHAEITPVKITDQTARPESNTEMSDSVVKIAAVLDVILRKIGETKTSEIVKLLQDNLPKIAEGSSASGLTARANQWVT